MDAIFRKKGMRIFNKTNIKRVNEREFLNKILDIFPNAAHLDTKYTLQDCLSDNPLKINVLIKKIERNKFTDYSF